MPVGKQGLWWGITAALTESVPEAGGDLLTAAVHQSSSSSSAIPPEEHRRCLWDEGFDSSPSLQCWALPRIHPERLQPLPLGAVTTLWAHHFIFLLSFALLPNQAHALQGCWGNHSAVL